MSYRTAGFLTVLCSSTLAAQGQASYAGTVGSAPIELVLNDTAEGLLSGVYFYPKFGTPIALSGQLRRGVLTLTEKDARGKASATLTIPAFEAGASQLAGSWHNLATGQSLPIVLTATNSRELLQVAALKDSYFKLVLASQPGEASQVVAVRILAKETNRLVQQVAVDCQLQGVHSVEVGDYNFDGLPDFSVFERSYAGPNTSSLYFLYDPAKRRFVNSGFEGTSLEFDEKAKRVYERNSCCAGTSVTSAVYKVVRNHLVLVVHYCFRWDEKKQELVERPYSACQ
ncbi:MAG: XAC2610-related protein [Janthinobacterium lividum]